MCSMNIILIYYKLYIIKAIFFILYYFFNLLISFAIIDLFYIIGGDL
jgi:hypothetical protein